MRKRKNTMKYVVDGYPLSFGAWNIVCDLEIQAKEWERKYKRLDEDHNAISRSWSEAMQANHDWVAANQKLKDELSAVCEANDQLENRVNDLGEQVDMWRRLCYDARQERNEAEDQLEDATGRATKDRWVEIKIMPLRNSANVTVTDQGSSDYILSYGSTWTFKVKI